MGLPTPPGHTGGLPDPLRTFGWDSQTSVWAFRPMLDVREGLPTPLRPTGVPPLPPVEPPDPTGIFGRASQHLPYHRVGLPTPPDLPGGSPDPSRTFGLASRHLMDVRVAFSTPL